MAAMAKARASRFLENLIPASVGCLLVCKTADSYFGSLSARISSL
jgi:hypothetical protein